MDPATSTCPSISTSASSEVLAAQGEGRAGAGAPRHRTDAVLRRDREFVLDAMAETIGIGGCVKDVAQFMYEAEVDITGTDDHANDVVEIVSGTGASENLHGDREVVLEECPGTRNKTARSLSTSVVFVVLVVVLVLW